MLQFQKYCEPLLHLSGCSVDIVKTDDVGHARSLIEQLKIMPDAIVVAGADGTSSEVVTGILRREHDAAKCPLVFLPLGKTNETAYKYTRTMPKTDLDYRKSLANTLLPLVYENCTPQSVIKFDILDASNDSNIKAIYGLTRFSWGILRDIEAIKDKYWYFGFLRHNAAAILNAFSTEKLIWKFNVDVEYTPPCEGCSNCVNLKKNSQQNKPLFMKLLREPATPESMAAQRVNVECNFKTQDHLEVNQLNIICNDNKELQTTCINSLEPGIDFVKNVPNVTRNNIAPAFELRSRTIELKPETKKSEEQFCTIDGEEFSIRHIRLSLIPNAINVFC